MATTPAKQGSLRRIAAIALALLLVAGVASAQIVRDGTVGPGIEVQPEVFPGFAGPVYDLPASLGAQRGGNLFHSFSEFSLRADPAFGIEAALFTDAGGSGGIEHIIARVTGDQQSRIDGFIASTVDGASLYLVNPRGVRFGPNARLDLRGSFHVSSADVLQLADGGRFHAADPAASLLTSAPPAAFGFLRAKPAEIAITESVLEVGSTAPGSLQIVGGELLVRGTDFGAELTAAGGGLVLVSAASPGEVPTDLLRRGTGPAFPERLGDVTLDFATLAVSDRFAGRNAGQLVLFGHDISIGPSTRLVADDAPDPETGFPRGGPFGGFIAIRAGGLFSIDGPARVSVSAEEAGLLSVQAGEARLGGASIFAENFFAPPRERTTIDFDVEGTLALSSSDLLSTTFGTSRAGDISIRAARLEMSGNTVIESSTRFDPNVVGNEIPLFGAGGRISVEVDELESSDRAQIVTLSDTTAPAGVIDIRVARDARIRGAPGESVPTGLASVANLIGAGGDIRLAAQNILLENAAITTESDPLFPQIGAQAGNAGSVALVATDAIRLVDSVVSASAETSFGGTLTFQAGKLIDARRSEINTTVFGGSGSGGNIFWDPTFIVLDRSPLTARAEFGDGGRIELTADFLFRSPETPLPDASSRFGTQGVVDINAPDTSIAGELASLPQSTLDASQLLRSPCAVNRSRIGSGSLVLEGGRGTPPTPDQVLSPGSGGYAIAQRAGAPRVLTQIAGNDCAGPSQMRLPR